MGSQEKIQKLAYELYERNGRREGRDLLDWLAAEQILRFEQLLFKGMDGEAAGLLEYKPLSDEGSAPKPPARPKAGVRRQPGTRRQAAARG